MKCTICDNSFVEKDIVTLDNRKICVKCVLDGKHQNKEEKQFAEEVTQNFYKKVEKHEKFGFIRFVKLFLLSFIPIFPWGFNYLYLGKMKMAVPLFIIYCISLTGTLLILEPLILLLGPPLRFITFIHNLSLIKKRSPQVTKAFEEKFGVYIVFLFIGIGATFFTFLHLNVSPSINIGLLVSASFIFSVWLSSKKISKIDEKDGFGILVSEAEEKVEVNEKENELQTEDISEEKQLASNLRSYTLTLNGTKLHKNLVKLSQTTDKIIAFISENPRKRRNLNKFFEYYLPTTLELLQKYTILIKHNEAGENVTSSKKSIEALAEELEKAFSNQLDMLFEEKKIDIDAEITVMKNIMEKEGLLDAV
ncbi:MAG: 5-bromo-4-chloroindolyl phosphate hydrolysis family protein [Defluviitaleaceae bacterium]|nr:5-bromo-4-chloroindolyl phosphate hydrolysis family protein [Defluviitaleaceae bacterium]